MPEGNSIVSRVTHIWCNTVNSYPVFWKNPVMSLDCTAAPSFLTVARLLACLAVTFWWHFTQSVRRLSISHCPPPSQTGSMWSTCQNCTHQKKKTKKSKRPYGNTVQSHIVFYKFVFVFQKLSLLDMSAWSTQYRIQDKLESWKKHIKWISVTFLQNRFHSVLTHLARCRFPDHLKSCVHTQTHKGASSKYVYSLLFILGVPENITSRLYIKQWTRTLLRPWGN